MKAAAWGEGIPGGVFEPKYQEMAHYEFWFIQAPLNAACRGTSMDTGPALIYLY